MNNKMKHIFIVSITLGILFFVVKCFYESTSLKDTRAILRNINEVDVKKGSIFFLDTSLNSYENEIVTLHRRAACAIESAALYHPNRSIYLIYMFPNDPELLIHIEDKYLRTILNYKNVHVLYAKISDFVKGTEIEGLFKKGILETSEYFITHSSDIFRTVVMLKYGGIYLDSDVIVLKSMYDLGGNFIGEQSQGYLASGIMGFDDKGKKLLSNILTDLNKHYNPKSWGGNGPGLYTKWIKNTICKTAKNYFKNQCDFLKILPPNSFYPIFYPSWKKLFEAKYTNEVLKSSNNSYLVHVWNKMSFKYKLDIKSNAPYLILAKNHCPQIFNKLYKSF